MKRRDGGGSESPSDIRNVLRTVPGTGRALGTHERSVGWNRVKEATSEGRSTSTRELVSLGRKGGWGWGKAGEGHPGKEGLTGPKG